MIRVIWAVSMTVIALLACFFVAGNFDPLSWEPAGRAFTVLIAVVVCVLTATCPFLVEERT
jgi:hypothetical protein